MSQKALLDLGPAIVVLAVLSVLQGCGGGTGAAQPSQAETGATASAPAKPVALPAGYSEIAVANGGAIRGVVTFKGVPPSQGLIQVTKDNQAFGDTIPDETLLVSSSGRIQNVVLFLEGITQGKPLPKELPAITNKGGRFVPHAQAFPQREFLIRSEDPVLHNTHPYLGRKEEGGRSLYNVAMSPPNPGEAKEVRQPLRAAGLHQIRCDAHDWMRGWIWVLDHPYGAVTSADGTYTIKSIPPGTYRFKAWHEKLGEQTVEVNVTAGGTLEVNFELSL